MDVEIYSMGMLCCSVCAPADMGREEVERRVNEQSPSGTSNGWRISEDKFFSDGETENGGVVNCSRGETRHWLLDC